MKISIDKTFKKYLRVHRTQCTPYTDECCAYFFFFFHFVSDDIGPQLTFKQAIKHVHDSHAIMKINIR